MSSIQEWAAAGRFYVTKKKKFWDPRVCLHLMGSALREFGFLVGVGSWFLSGLMMLCRCTSRCTPAWGFGFHLPGWAGRVLQWQSQHLNWINAAQLEVPYWQASGYEFCFYCDILLVIDQKLACTSDFFLLVLHITAAACNCDKVMSMQKSMSKGNTLYYE